MSFQILRPVNLPAPLILQSLASCGLGLYISIFRRGIALTSTYSVVAPPLPASPRHADALTMLGAILTALEINYLASSYMPFEENQFIASSVPIQMGVGILLAGMTAWKRNDMSNEGLWELSGLAGIEIAAAVWLGFSTGRWDGMVYGADKWL
jgi:hypothetical protein